MRVAMLTAAVNIAVFAAFSILYQGGLLSDRVFKRVCAVCRGMIRGKGGKDRGESGKDGKADGNDARQDVRGCRGRGVGDV